MLYAEENRMMLVYAREDTVAFAYAVHLEDVCVGPNLLALYRSRVDGDGWRIADGGYQLPALNNGQVFGTADMVDFYLRSGQPGKAAAQMDRLAATIAATYRHTARRPYWDAKLAAFRRALAAPDGRSSN